MKKFAVVVHPRDISDVARPLPWARYFPAPLLSNIIKRVPKRFNIYHWTSFDVYGKAEGYIIVVFLTGEQMVSLPRKYVQERILEAVLYAQDKLGVDVVGLGAYTAPLTDGGRWLARQKKVKVSITHGDSFSVALAYHGVLALASNLNINLREKEVAILGAYGLIGKPLSRLISQDVGSLMLIGRRESKLKKLREELGDERVKTSTELSDMVHSDIVIAATSYPGSLIRSGHLKKGAIVYDIAQPINLSPAVCLERPDILRIDGCYTKIPNIDLKIEMGPPSGTTFSCLAETIMQTLEDEDGHHVGEIDIVHVEKTIVWKKKYGFEHAEFTNFGNPVPIRK